MARVFTVRYLILIARARACERQHRSIFSRGGRPCAHGADAHPIDSAAGPAVWSGCLVSEPVERIHSPSAVVMFPPIGAAVRGAVARRTTSTSRRGRRRGGTSLSEERTLTSSRFEGFFYPLSSAGDSYHRRPPTLPPSRPRVPPSRPRLPSLPSRTPALSSSSAPFALGLPRARDARAR